MKGQTKSTPEVASHIAWRARIKRRRGKTFNPIQIRELNLVAMMDMLTILLVFLLKSYSVSAIAVPVAEELRVPISKNIMIPPDAVKIMVTNAIGKTGVIAVDEHRVVALDPKKMGSLKGMAKNRQYKIAELGAELDKKADNIRKISQLNPTVKFDGKVLVIADKNTPYWLITQVLYTAAESQFDQYKLVALKESAD